MGSGAVEGLLDTRAFGDQFNERLQTASAAARMDGQMASGADGDRDEAFFRLQRRSLLHVRINLVG